MNLYRKQNKSFLGCYIEIQTGLGGIDAVNWSKILLRMYIKWAINNCFNTKILTQSPCGNFGFKSVTLQINGSKAYYQLYKETGIHRLVRTNPFKKNKKKQTSFSSVSVYPIINNTNDHSKQINFNTTNIKIDTFRSSGAGGQHVNCTDSAVRITHIPTGITTQCQSQRSQHKNKFIALNQLQAKLYISNMIEKDKKKKIMKKNQQSIQWGNQIRSYFIDDNKIKDLRTGKETSQVKDVLNGKLDFFLI